MACQAVFRPGCILSGRVSAAAEARQTARPQQTAARAGSFASGEGCDARSSKTWLRLLLVGRMRGSGSERFRREPLPCPRVEERRAQRQHRLRVAHVSQRGSCATTSRTSTRPILRRPVWHSKHVRPSAPICAHSSAPRHAPTRARRCVLTPTSSSRQPSGAGGPTQSQPPGGARSTGSGGSGATPSTQSGTGSPVTSMPTVSGCVHSAGTGGSARCAGFGRSPHAAG